MTDLYLNTCINVVKNGKNTDQLGFIQFLDDKVTIEVPGEVCVSLDRYVLDELLKRERHEGK